MVKNEQHKMHFKNKKIVWNGFDPPPLKEFPPFF